MNVFVKVSNRGVRINRDVYAERKKSVKMIKLSSNPESDLKTENLYKTFWHFLLKVL